MALRTRITPLSHSVGEGLGVRANNSKRASNKGFVAPETPIGISIAFLLRSDNFRRRRECRRTKVSLCITTAGMPSHQGQPPHHDGRNAVAPRSASVSQRRECRRTKVSLRITTARMPLHQKRVFSHLRDLLLLRHRSIFGIPSLRFPLLRRGNHCGLVPLASRGEPQGGGQSIQTIRADEARPTRSFLASLGMTKPSLRK